MCLRMPFKLIKEEKALCKAINHLSGQPVYFQKKISPFGWPEPPRAQRCCRPCLRGT